MKRFFIAGLAAFLLIGRIAAQTSSWNQDYASASAEAKKSGKLLLIDFSGSDWCPWCIKLDKEVFNQPAFKKYAKGNLVLMLADFPRKKKLPEAVKKQNETLAQKFNIEGFPTVVLLDASGKTIAVTGYQPGGAKAYVKHLKALIAKPAK